MKICMRFHVHTKHIFKDAAFSYKKDMCYYDEVTHDIPYLYDYIDRGSIIITHVFINRALSLDPHNVLGRAFKPVIYIHIYVFLER